MGDWCSFLFFRQIRPVACNPTLYNIVKLLCLLDTLNHGLVADGVPSVITAIALLAQCIQHNHRALFQSDGFWKSLNRGLMMPRLTGGSAITVSPQRHHRALHDGLVGGIEAIFSADFFYPRIRDIARGGLQQTLRRFARRVMRLKLFGLE